MTRRRPAPVRRRATRSATIGRTITIVLALITVTAVSCVAADPATVDGVVGPDGFEVSELVTGLDGPTQLVVLDDGRLLVAELAGAESDGTGRISVVTIGDEPATGATEILFDGLLKPTGVAAIGDEVWVMEERTLSRGPATGGELTEVAGQLPYNGRSETTLTVAPDGRLLYGTSGSIRGGGVVADSGVLWSLDPTAGARPEPEPVAAGLKNPYGHVFDADGGLWVTEVSDGSFDGEPAADELVAVTPGVDHGWPACVGDRRPVAEFGGDPALCEAGPPSHALFEPGATPTAVAVAPWDPDVLLVAVWSDRSVVSIPRTAPDPDAGTGEPHVPTDFLTGEIRPQHLVADGDRLLVVDIDGDRILAVTPT